MFETAVWCLAGVLELLFIIFMFKQCFPNARQHITDYKNGFMYMLKDWWYIYTIREFSYFYNMMEDQVGKDAIAAGLTPGVPSYKNNGIEIPGDMMCIRWSGENWEFYKNACEMTWFERLRSKK